MPGVNPDDYNAGEYGFAIEDELRRARERFPKFHSAHEGFAILKEEVDEMWDEIKANNIAKARAEAVQVGAMALAFLEEVK
jgi:hypothetical protein